MRFLTVLILVTFLFSSCYKDVESSEVIEIIIESPKDEFDTGLVGQVFDSEDAALSGYELEINSSSYTIPGEFFSLKLGSITEKGQLIEVFQNDKLIGLDYLYALGNDINKVEINNLDGFEESTFSSGNHVLDDNSSFAVEYNDAFEDAIGNEVASDLIIRSKAIDDIQTIRKFANSGFLKNGELVVLNPALAVLVTFTADGQRVFSSENSIIKISSLENRGKTLFGYDRAFNYWRELGELGETSIVTTVFDHYVIADYEAGSYNEGIITQEMKPISFANGAHQLDSRSFEFISTEQGRWAQVLPQSGTLDTEVYNPCNEVVGQVTTETNSSENRNYQMSLTETVPSVTLEADIIDCAAELAEVPSISITEQGSATVHTFSDSEINHTLLTCGKEIQLAAVNLEEESQGPEMGWNTDEVSSVNFLTNCSENQDGYSYLKIRNDKQPYPSFTYSVVNGETVLSSEDRKVVITFAGDMKGQYQEEDVHITIDDPEFGPDGYTIDCDSPDGCGFSSFEVSHFDQQGEGWLRITFQGILWMQTIQNFKYGDFDVEGVILIKA